MGPLICCVIDSSRQTSPCTSIRQQTRIDDRLYLNPRSQQQRETKQGRQGRGTTATGDDNDSGGHGGITWIRRHKPRTLRSAYKTNIFALTGRIKYNKNYNNNKKNANDNYNNKLTIGSLPLRVVRIARQLPVTPVELVEPILADLPLHRVLDLLSTQYGIGSTSGDGGGALEAAITNGYVWPRLAQADRVRLKALWVAYNQFSLFLNGKRAEHVYFAPSYIKYSSPSLRNSWLGDNLVRIMADDLNDCFVRNIFVEERFQHRGTKLRDLCAYLPAGEDLSRFWRPVDPEEFGSMRYKKDRDCREVKEIWTVDDTMRLIPQLRKARRDLNDAKSKDLQRLASLYELFPTYLTKPGGSQIPVQNPRHIPQMLRGIARKQTRSPTWFQYAHPGLIPCYWCFQLFDTALQQPETSEMKKATGTSRTERAEERGRTKPGMKREEERGRTTETGDEPDFRADLQKARDGLNSIYASGLPRTSTKDGYKRQELHNLNNLCLPSPIEELEWLESFLRCVKRMETRFPELALESKAAAIKRWCGPNSGALLEEADFRRLIDSPTYCVVQQLKADLKVSKKGNGKLPSLVALYLPPFSSPRARQIASDMWPQADLRSGVRQMMYEEMVKTIKGRISQPHDVDFQDGQGEIQPYQPTKDWNNHRRTSYICHTNLDQTHKTFGSMCVTCGDFNLAERALSLPENLSLAGQTALVTGARVNLGFHTASAFVIASSRYPEDAFSRYQKESDFEIWADRLRVVGADFRAARDAFALVEATKAILQKEQRNLDILINNAAQTLTDSVAKEQKAIHREQLLLDQSTTEGPGKFSLVVRQGYTARVRGGATGMISGQETGLITSESNDTSSLVAETSNLQLSEASGPSSWVQSLSDIPYEDVISAHSVNTFVPLILVRELMPLMLQGGHIINVSSREGIFESQLDSPAKAGKHVHINMSKAGLNMITETEAATAWKQRKVAMNTVDPGYMSSAPEFEMAHGGEPPIGWEDGAGRVLWPIAQQQKRGAPIWVAS
ncbi:hypothetical protein CPLU01_12338 [Colletotrichum plurivorum]|uniref:Uncharacterized protein n=1 Tax=Colletotrichum plurivorum TaxID=2175906 RepID=A0A8H6JZD5_9PEZI|nr:hypothetical protein CPLU01_12338 [Colletotrichum plurivorum]